MQGCSRAVVWVSVLSVLSGGCRGHQTGTVVKNDSQMVGSHTAGAEVWLPLVQSTTAKLLARQASEIQQTGFEQADGLPPGAHPLKKRVCFIGIENRSIEELADAREEMYEQIDTVVNGSEAFEMISRRAVDAGLRRCGLTPNDLFAADNQARFAATMGKMESPIDYLLFGKVTTISTYDNKDSERDYKLTLELTDVHSGKYIKESEDIRKGYTSSKLKKLKRYGRD